jgi:hypothetical protein
MQYGLPLNATLISSLVTTPFAASARAQVVIPHGDFGDGFETYLVAIISFALLCFAVWRFYRGR